MAWMTGSVQVLAGVIGLALASMAVYAATGARRDADATRRGTHFLMGAGDFVVHWFLWAISPLDRASLALGLGPTQMVLLALTVVVSVLTVVPGRATRLQGGVHLVLLAAFVFLAVNP